MKIIQKPWTGTPGVAGLRGETMVPVAIVYHWTANPRAKAYNEYHYRNSLIDKQKVSWHYTLGQSGRILQHMGDTRPGWHCSHNWYNAHSIGIECCPLDEEGNYSDETYRAMVELGRHLIKEYPIKEVLRHDDCIRKAGGRPKGCPRYFSGTQGEARWKKFLAEVWAA